MTILELLKAGLVALGPNGEHWGKREKIYQHGNECAITTLWAGMEVAYADRYNALKESEKLVQAATEILRKNLPSNAGGLVSQFNDDPITTFEDIKSLYERSIQSLEAK